MRRRWLQVGALVFVCASYLVLTSVAGIFIAEGTLHPVRRAFSAGSQVHAPTGGDQASVTNVVVTARDGVSLRGWSVRPAHPSGRAVILLHGLGDNRLGMLGYADLLLREGFSVLMPDARAHGASDGQLATYGLLESDDVRVWFEWLQRNQRPTCTFGFAESMGAAQLLQSLRLDVPFCAVAVESPFSSLREIAYDRIGQFFDAGPLVGRILLRPAVEVAFGYARLRYGLDFAQVSPESTVSATTIPVLLIHGIEDSNIPIRHSRQIAARNSRVVMWEVPGADHSGAMRAAGQQFSARLIGWFEDHMVGSAAMKAGMLY